MLVQLIFDTGPLYDLALDQGYAAAARGHWHSQKAELWVPASVRDEIRHRQRVGPPPGLPAQAPGRAAGLITSNGPIRFQPIHPDDEEQRETASLQERQEPAYPTQHLGESEAAVLLAHRAPTTGILITGDTASVPILRNYVQKHGATFSFMTTTEVLDGMASAGVISPNERLRIAGVLQAAGRPHC